MKLPEWLKELIDRNKLIAEVDKEITPIKNHNKKQLDVELKNDQEKDQINNLEDGNMENNKKLKDFAANLKGLNVEDLFVKRGSLDPMTTFLNEYSEASKSSDINDNKPCDCECGRDCDGDCECGGNCKCDDNDNKCCSGNCKCDEYTNKYSVEDTEEAVSNALDDILEKIDFVKYKLYNNGKCHYCGGYIMYDLSDPQLDLLKLLGFELPEDAKICHCGMDTKIKVKDEVKDENDIDEVIDVDDALSFTQQYPVNTEISNVTDSDEDDTVEILWACEDGVETPHKNEEDLGYDVKAHFDTDEWVIPPHTTSLVPTGLYAAVPVRWGLIAKEKGSTGAIGMKCGAGVIDSGYRAEIFIAITNENDSFLIITKDPEVKKVTYGSYKIVLKKSVECSYDAIYYPYKKGIAQLLLVPNPKSKGKKISIEELKAIPSIRGEGKLGSTDKF